MKATGDIVCRRRSGVRVLCLGVILATLVAEANTTTQPGPVTPKELQRMVATREITDGSYRSLTIGDSKDESLAGLREMGVVRITPEVGNPARAMTSTELVKLDDVEAVCVGAGEIVIKFDDSEIREVGVSPRFPEWKQRLDGVKTRHDAFDALAVIMDASPGVAARECARDDDPVWLAHLTRETRELLEKYDVWDIAHDEEGGTST